MTINKLKRSTWIKVFGIMIVAIILGLSPIWAEYEKPIGENSLPAQAKTFLQQHFPTEKIAFAKEENDYWIRTYEVILSGGVKIEFRRNGEWKKVEAKYGDVPPAIIPRPISEYLSRNFPGTTVREIEKKKREYELELSNSLELKFDSQEFFLTDYDD